jgi:hypothetical protein
VVTSNTALKGRYVLLSKHDGWLCCCGGHASKQKVILQGLLSMASPSQPSEMLPSIETHMFKKRTVFCRTHLVLDGACHHGIWVSKVVAAAADSAAEVHGFCCVTPKTATFDFLYGSCHSSDGKGRSPRINLPAASQTVLTRARALCKKPITQHYSFGP